MLEDFEFPTKLVASCQRTSLYPDGHWHADYTIVKPAPPEQTGNRSYLTVESNRHRGAQLSNNVSHLPRRPRDALTRLMHTGPQSTRSLQIYGHGLRVHTNHHTKASLAFVRSPIYLAWNVGRRARKCLA